MGNRNSGPRPSPTKLKILRGVTRTDRLNPKEPQIEPAPESFDVPPPEMTRDKVAIAEWGRVVPILRRVGLVSELERGALIALCQQWSRYVAAQVDIRKKGPVLDGEHGPMLNPSITIADKSLTHCLKLWQELGLTPSGRSKMIALVKPEPPVVSKWAGLV
jgi:P27 family predicted phage terminase small subunit